MLFIGDVHSKWDRYKKIIASVPASIQVGDFGVGFRRLPGHLNEGEIYSNPPHSHMVAGNHRFIRGNHDNPEECKKHSQWIPDGTIENGVMFIGGALSIDQHIRTKDYNWWSDEELSTETLRNFIDTYAQARPHMMVTHDAPDSVVQHLFGRGVELKYPSRTREALNFMWTIHKPALWIFGHWHQHKDLTTLGTRFICLDELQTMDLPLTPT